MLAENNYREYIFDIIEILVGSRRCNNHGAAVGLLRGKHSCLLEGSNQDGLASKIATKFQPK